MLVRKQKEVYKNKKKTLAILLLGVTMLYQSLFGVVTARTLSILFAITAFMALLINSVTTAEVTVEVIEVLKSLKCLMLAFLKL